MSDWEHCFPYPKFRDGQKEVIDSIISKLESEDVDFVVLEAPTGAGKSAIGYTVGSYFKDYYYVTAQKILQSQLSNDFGPAGKWINDGASPMTELKGRNAYECTFYKEATSDYEYRKGSSKDKLKRLEEQAKSYVDCSVGECKKQQKSKLDYCKERHICPYYNQLYAALRSDAVLMNFHSYIFQTAFVQAWPNKKLLIVDEAHNAEQVLMDYISFTFNDANYSFQLPDLETAEEYYMFFEDIDMMKIIINNIRSAIAEGDSKEEEYWVQQKFKYEKFTTSIMTHEWIPKWETKEIKGLRSFRQVELKPLYVKHYINDTLLSKVDKVLFMSATILDVNIMCDSLGLDRSRVYAKRLGSDFPVENRPIVYDPCGSMAYKEKGETMPKMMIRINEICDDHSNERGIIHTHNFEIAKYIQENGSSKLKQRLFFQHNYDSKENMLDQHAKSRNGIIIAPAMHEGLDLKDDLARFQIICKVPYPGLGANPQLRRRMELDGNYYQYLTALKLVQSYGRAIRSNTDKAKTYILDSGFERFYSESAKMLPKWFRDAIVW